MSKMLSIVLTAGLLVYPFATYAAGYGSQSDDNQQAPPVAQTLVREGDFAMKLAVQLGLGSPADEATAEDLLAQAGITPLNGWISDYPVTPEIIGQLNDAVRNATKTGKLSLNEDTAAEKLAELADEMEVARPAGGAASAGPPPDTGALNDYYAYAGPPIVTYYPPPADYLYLYDWVPYPVVWFGLGFPGFFICHSFTTIVTVGPHGHVHGHGHRGIVTNHVNDPRANMSAFLVHGRQAGRDSTKMLLRTENGRTFRTLHEFRGTAAGGPRTEKAEFASGALQRGFRSPEARKSAEVVQSRSIQAMTAPGRVGPMARNFSSPLPRTFNGQKTLPGPFPHAPRFSNSPSRHNSTSLSTPFSSGRAMARPSVPPSIGPRSFSGGFQGRGAGGFGGHAGHR